jgi:PRTRC genetic system protein B
MYFVKNLEIPNGKAQVPAMLWFADKENLSVFALTSDKRPTEKTPLYYAPFFNVYEDGAVCMGTVDVNIKNSASVEEFTRLGKIIFSILISVLYDNYNPINGNCVNLWKKLMETENFPAEY